MSGRYNNHIKELQGWNDLFVKWSQVDQSYNIAPGKSVAAFRDINGGSVLPIADLRTTYSDLIMPFLKIN